MTDHESYRRAASFMHRHWLTAFRLGATRGLRIIDRAWNHLNEKQRKRTKDDDA